MIIALRREREREKSIYKWVGLTLLPFIFSPIIWKIQRYFPTARDTRKKSE